MLHATGLVDHAVQAARTDAVDEVRRLRRHPPPGAPRAAAATFTRERHEQVMLTARAPEVHEASGEISAAQIFSKQAGALADRGEASERVLVVVDDARADRLERHNAFAGARRAGPARCGENDVAMAPSIVRCQPSEARAALSAASARPAISPAASTDSAMIVTCGSRLARKNEAARSTRARALGLSKTTRRIQARSSRPAPRVPPHRPRLGGKCGAPWKTRVLADVTANREKERPAATVTCAVSVPADVLRVS